MFYPNLLILAYFIHLMHNCAMKVRSSDPIVDNLIASMRMAMLKNSIRRELINNISLRLDVMITRWGSQLHAVNYYCEYLPNLKPIVELFEEIMKLLLTLKMLSIKRIFIQACWK